MANENKKKTHAHSFPEHGPIAENGKEILLSVQHVDINFGKGDNLVRAAKDVTFDIYRRGDLLLCRGIRLW